MLAISFCAGAVPFSGWSARLLAGVDLREQGAGTVSGTGLYEVAGFAPLAVAGSLEVAVGAVGPLLAGRDRPVLGAVAGGLAITGHNWSPFLSGAGGRGISTVLGATLALTPEGTVVMAAGLGGGRLARQTGLGCFVALVALFPVLARRHGLRGAFTALCLTAPVLAKRVVGNRSQVAGETSSSSATSPSIPAASSSPAAASPTASSSAAPSRTASSGVSGTFATPSRSFLHRLVFDADR